MKYKNHVRIFGAYQTVLSSAINIPLVHGAFFSDSPIYAKIGYGTMAVFCSLVTADGLVDMVRGNQKAVDKIESSIHNMLKYREQEHSIFRRKH
jgi:hypothetical protein